MGVCFSTTISVPSTIDPITLQEAKDYAKVEVSDDDTLIDALITNATEYAENFTRRAFTTKTVILTIDWCFPHVIELPINPVLTVPAATFTYVDNDGVVTQVPTSVYVLDIKSDPARIYLDFDQVWPDARFQREAISVLYTAGYGATAADIPENIRTAVKMMVTYHYETRQPHAGSVGGSILTFPRTVDDLLLPYTAITI